MYQGLGLQVESPQNLMQQKDKFDWLIIAVFSRNTMRHIRKNLTDIGIQPEKILWFTEAFVESNILDAILAEEG